MAPRAVETVEQRQGHENQAVILKPALNRQRAGVDQLRCVRTLKASRMGR